MKQLFVALAFWLLMTGAAQAQTDEGYEEIPLRISGSGAGGSVLVDRGRRDGLEIGDRVLFRPRSGTERRGTVLRVDGRSAVVELLGRGPAPRLGTRGVALVPSSRFEDEPVPPAPTGNDPPATGAGDPPETQGTAAGPEDGAGSESTDPADPRSSGREAPVYEEQDEDWREGMPLLAQVRALRPESRNPSVTGRMYVVGDQTYSTQDDRHDLFYRAGTDVDYLNPFGRGGRLSLDAEVNYRVTDVPGQVDESDGRLRLDRVSYAWGGTRFAPERWEVGRFLQSGMPEFGVLDGVEWVRRRENGHRYGASVGFMPVPDPDFESGHDFQVAGFYHWVSDESERLSVTGGFQKTFHNSNADRDLFVAKFRYLPVRGWDLQGQAWVDYYSSGDDAKNATFEVTQAQLYASRRFENGNGMDVSFRRLRFPDIDRFEFLPLLDDELQDNHYDRLAVSGWAWTGEDTRVRAELGGFNDEDGFGGDVELGLETTDLFQEQSRSHIAVFATAGQFENLVGTRLGYGRYLENGRWDVFYEFGAHHLEGFSSNFDDLNQHRLRASRDFRFGAGWNLALYAEGRAWDEELSGSLGFYLQKSF